MTAEMGLQILMAAVGSLGFSLLFRLYPHQLPFTVAGGAFNWYFYLITFRYYEDRVLSFFLATLATAVLAELLARILKMPVITLVVPMLIPLIPGGDLYYTMLALVQSDVKSCSYYGGLVLREAAAMSLGIIIVACAVQTVLRFSTHLQRKK